MSIDDLSMAHEPHVPKPRVTDITTIARHLPDTLVAQIFGYLSLQELKCFLRCKASCSNDRTVSDVANIVLYKDVRVDTKERLESLRRGHPDPESFAYLVENLSIPGFISGEMREYVSDIFAKGSGIRGLAVGTLQSELADYPISSSNSLRSTPYIPRIPPSANIRSLTIGRIRRIALSSQDPFVDFSELAQFPNLRELQWINLDNRLGSVKKILCDIHRYCPNLEILKAPWGNRLDDGTAWSSIPDFPNLKMLMFRFRHGFRIDVRSMHDCLTEFWKRDVAVQIGHRECNMDIVKWLGDLYNTIYFEESARGQDPAKIFQWVLQNNRHKLIKTTELDPRTTRKMYEALNHVDASKDADGLGLEIQIKREPLPPFAFPYVRHLRLLNDRANVDPRTIRNVISSNPHLKDLAIAVHINHHGNSYDGNITTAKVPLIPGQNTIRSSGVRTTLPGFEVRYEVLRNKSGELSQRWKSYTMEGVRPTATVLPDLNIFNLQNFVPEEWTEELLTRLHTWEREIKAYFDLNSNLKKVYINLNTDRHKFGRFESLCSCARRI